MRQKILYGVGTIVSILIIFYIVAQQKTLKLESLDINLSSTHVTFNGESFNLGGRSEPLIDFLTKSLDYQLQDSGWSEYIEKVGVCPSEEVRVLSYGDLDLFFMKQGEESILASWALSRRSSPVLPGKITVDNFIELGNSIKTLEGKYKENLNVTNDDIKGAVFSIIENINYPEYYYNELELPASVPLTGNLNRSLTVDKMEAGFLCVN